MTFCIRIPNPDPKHWLVDSLPYTSKKNAPSRYKENWVSANIAKLFPVNFAKQISVNIAEQITVSIDGTGFVNHSSRRGFCKYFREGSVNSAEQAFLFRVKDVHILRLINAFMPTESRVQRFKKQLKIPNF